MIWMETVCDMCNTVCTGMCYKKGCISALKKETKGFGWKYVKGELYCPKCQERIKEKR